MRGCTSIKSRHPWMLPALILCVGATSFGAIDFTNNTLTYSSTSDLAATIDPPGQRDVTNSYGIDKDSFLSLSPQVVAFNSAPAATQTLRTLIANYDDSHTVTFTFPAAMYNYGSMTSVGRGAFSGSSLQDAISTVPVLSGGLYDWFDATITSTGGKGVRALGFCVAFRNNQEVKAGQVLYTLSDATTATIDLPVLGNAGNIEYIFIGYQAPAGKTITRVQASRTDTAGGGYVSIDDLAFVMSAPEPDITAPDAVSDLTTGAPTTSSITLTWTAPGDDGSVGIATSYDIRYSTSVIDESNWDSATQVSGEPTPVGAGTAQTMVVSGLSSGTTYYFAIKTSDEVPNISDISSGSPNGTTLEEDPIAPDAVSNLHADTPTSSSLTLTWTAPGDDGSTGTATSYDIRYATSVITEANWASAIQATGEPAPAPAGTSQSMVVGSLSASTTYYFAIKTSDELGNISAISNSPSGQTLAPGSSSIIALKRDPGLVAGGGIDPRFAGATVVTTTVQDAQMDGTQISRWYNGGRVAVSSGMDYTARLAHKYDLASVPAYAKINLAQLRLYSTKGAGNCGLGMILTHDWIEGTKVDDYPGAAGGITYWAPIGYNTYFDQNPSGGGSPPWGGWGPNSDSGFDMTVDCGPLVNPSASAQSYYVFDVTAHVQAWVRGIRPNFGWGQYDGKAICFSESASDIQPVLFIDYALEGDTTPPATVADLTSSNVTTDSVTLTCTAPGDDGLTGTAASYEIRYSMSPITAASWVLATPVAGVATPQAGGTTQNLIVSGLASDVTYYFAMKASDEVPNVAALSNVVMAHTLPDIIPPAAVSNLATSNLTNHSVTLTWTAPGDDDNVGTAASYDIRYSTSTITDANWASAMAVTGEPAPAVAGTSQSLVIDNLTQNTTYYFAIKASDERPNTSSLSNVASGQTLPDTIAPGAVINLTITKAKSSALRLAWIASGDDGDVGTAASYDVRYSTSPLNDGNWSVANQVTDEPVAVQPGYHRNMWIRNLLAGTTYYVGIKVFDEVSNASTIATASATTPAASRLTRPLLQPDDFEYLGAFKLPRFACSQSTAYSSAGIAIRRVNGNLQFLAESGYYDGSALYECNFPGWGANLSTWPQATIVHEWGTAIYGTPSVKPSGPIVTSGLSYDEATGRLYYSYASGYNVSQENVPSLGCAVLDEGGPIASGPWLSPNVTIQAMRGGSLMIPDWFADTYLAGRKLGVGFGGGYSGWASCSPGPVLAAAHHPAGSATELDTVPLLQYDQTDLSHWCTRDARYWVDGVYNLHDPVGDIGWWISMDSVGASAWIDLPDKQGLLYLTGRGIGRTWYDYGKECVERTESWWWVYDPADLAEVAQGHMNTWEPQHDSWQMQYRGPGCAFDAETRTLFVITPGSYQVGGQESFPVVHGYWIKLLGDVNKDAHVDVEDLLYVVDAFSSAVGDPNWDIRCDFNSDGSVDVVDLLVLVENFGI